VPGRRSLLNIAFISISAANLFCCVSGNEKTLFRQRQSDATNVTFINDLSADGSIDRVSFEYLYNGAGVAVGDVNNDGLSDIFFAGNVVSSELYLNRGDLKFEEITESAGLTTHQWCTGVSVVDINDDGLKDIYVCVGGYDTINKTRENIFFINQGVDENGIPRFIDKAKEMGLNDRGYSTMGAFFDYDKDGDIDLFLLTNSMDGVLRSMVRPIKKDGRGKSTDRLYRNDGDGRFTDVSSSAGIVNEGYGLGVGLSDINQDGWLDVYCANDFVSNDLLYVNNQDGTFSERSSEYFHHFTHNGMGMDLSDVNNDGLTDVIVLDMLPIENTRQKLMLASNAMTFQESLRAGFHPQFLRNTLQLNRGKFKDAKYRFSEVGYLAGIYQTDWSWAPLSIDFDDDGWKDLLITNGFRKDVTNLDYINKIAEISRFGTKEAKKALIEEAMNNLPEVKLTNFVFKNNGDLTFSDKSVEWGLVHPTFTNGTALADFDNDGDVDLVLNNIDQEAVLYENRLRQSELANQHHYLNFRFDSSVSEGAKIGLKLWLFHEGDMQFVEYSPFRGYKSTMDELIHFGLGNVGKVDSILLEWPDGMRDGLYEVPVDTIIYLNKKDTSSRKFVPEGDKAPVSFVQNTEIHGLNFIHRATSSSDFKITPTLLHSLSHYGPSISGGDINNDGFDDVFVGGDEGVAASIMYQDANSRFTVRQFDHDPQFHDAGSLLFDADNDGDLDLYVVSGGYRWPRDHENYQDRLYLNDLKGNFEKRQEVLPQIRTSGSCVISADYDKDGDLDLFVGGRVEGHSYPDSPQSYLLENKSGVFVDRSELLGGTKGKLGMVTSALWTDVNGDQNADMILAGEWMPVTVLINENGQFADKTKEYKLEDSSGWWNSLSGADLDNDGDIDYLLGNYGLNSFYKASQSAPLRLYARDFDHNGSMDPVITYSNHGKDYFVHTLDVISRAIPGMKKRFRTYTDYGQTEFRNSFTAGELENALEFECRMMESVILENRDNKTFIFHNLPMDVQFSPVFGAVLDDLNEDGLKDIILIGNSMHEETIFGYYDASYGNVLINKGDFQWQSLGPAQSNFVAEGDKKSLVKIRRANGGYTFLAGENGGALESWSVNEMPDGNFVRLETDDWWISWELNGRKVKTEAYYGEGFLSSSTRSIQIPKGAGNVEIYKYNGERRAISLSSPLVKK
jgi:hypothetical protein